MNFTDEAKDLLTFYFNSRGAVFVSLDDGKSVVTPDGRRINSTAVLTPTDESRWVGDLYQKLTPEQLAHVDPWIESEAERLEWEALVDGI